ncbi:DNA repair protein RadC [Anaerospora hongkongensis]|uniref:DNA repair protein RadC n=1 Tax=Anaerospora hongkongensis TaxID=244830 RepID=A0A4R1Q4C1_9FIRM|nr:DNA repair protein RadC [Anaerospora hongkongensis]TCL36245.1 DNA repair protein RadC [Anaerospora hongkongensis]
MIMPSTLSNVTDETLLEAVLPKPAVRELMAEYGSVQQALLQTYPQELKLIKGIGPVKARQLQYLCELAKRIYRADSKLPPVIRGPQDVFDRVLDMQYLPVEQFRVLYLNTRNGVIAEEAVSQGTLNAALVGPRELFRRAVRLMAAIVILVHNHPSGDPAPSQEDIALTKNLAAAGEILGIAVADHLIIGKGKYISFKEKGLLA